MNSRKEKERQKKNEIIMCFNAECIQNKKNHISFRQNMCLCSYWFNYNV